MKIKAFTLTELLIALAVIGILIAILLPIIFGLMPNQNVLMAKRAYYTIQTVVSDMINNEACYPNKTQASDTEKRVGFDDGYGYAYCELWGMTSDTAKYINEEDANSKFLTLFVNKLDLKKENNDNDNQNILVNLNGATTYSFTTKDGIKWTAKNMKLAKSNSDPSIELTMDLNGDDGPNCSYPDDPNNSKCKNSKEFDRFSVVISADGKLRIVENWAAKAVAVNADISKVGYN